jgi:3-hydroxyisobutyrate dehydrogenase-like beta-hydroxyacid dehydrogenase
MSDWREGKEGVFDGGIVRSNLTIEREWISRFPSDNPSAGRKKMTLSSHGFFPTRPYSRESAIPSRRGLFAALGVRSSNAHLRRNDMVNVGWIGTGKLGLPMAARVAASGNVVRAYVRSRERSETIRARNLICVTFEEMAAQSIVFTSLPDDAALCQVAEQLFPTLRPGAVLVETSTVSPNASSEIANLLNARGISYLRAPVSGNPIAAEAGKLTAMVSGPKEAFDIVQSVMTSYSHAQFWLGGGEQARYTKLAINLMLAVSAGMLGEALALARRGEVASADILDVVAASALGSPMVIGKVSFLKAGDYTATFTGQQMAKDLDLILGAANETGVAAPLAALMRTQFAAIRAGGELDQDFIAVVKVAQRLAGLGEAPQS